MSGEICTTRLRSGAVIEYTVRKSKRAKRSSLTLYPDGQLVATIPWFRTALAAQRLVHAQRNWIERHVPRVQKNPAIRLEGITQKNKKEYAQKAHALLASRVSVYSEMHGFTYNAIRVKTMRTQWGSCSRRKNLNFNIKIVFLPADLVDYIVVHELCHLKEMNHGTRFWNLVESILPDYREREKRLGTYLVR